MSRPRRLRTVTTLCTAATLLVISACDQLAGTTTGTATGIEVGKVAGLDVTNFPSGLADDAPTPDVAAENATGSEVDTLAIATIADLNEYWGAVLPEQFGLDYQPLRRLLSYDARVDDIRICNGSTRGLENAFFCPAEDVVAWDRGLLFPKLHDLYGALAPVTVMAHEWGHAIQHRLGEKAGITPETTTIVKELQADCFTGNYFRWVVEGNSKYFVVSTGEGLNSALSTLYHVRDPAGTLRADRRAHGTSFDRTYAFGEGFEHGPRTCAGYTDELLAERTTQQKFSEDDLRSGKGDVLIDEEHLELVTESLDSAFDGVAGPRVRADGGVCPSGPRTRPASYCPDENAVTVDLSALARVGEPIDQQAEWEGNPGQGKGDFAAWASVASRYVLAVQRRNGAAIDDELAPLRTACLVGSWAGAANQPRDVPRIIRLSPGDVDEAILEMLQPRSLIASDVNGNQVPSGFLRIEAFRIGYNDGPDTCKRHYQ